jgi:hypothetical protein
MSDLLSLSTSGELTPPAANLPPPASLTLVENLAGGVGDTEGKSTVQYHQCHNGNLAKDVINHRYR